MCRIPLTLAVFLGFGGLVRGQLDTSSGDLELLRRLELKEDGPSLREYLVGQTQAARRLPRLIEQLGDAQFRARERASAELIRIGPVALKMLELAQRHPDPETAKRAKTCWDAIRRQPDPLPAAIRQLARYNPEGTAGVLLDYLPHATSRFVAEQARLALAQVAVRGKSAEPVLVQALSEENPLRRGAAAEALARASAREHLPAVRKLLADRDHSVRQRVALALAWNQEREAIPVLIDLISEVPRSEWWSIEDVLLCLAEGETPQRPAAHDDRSVAGYRDAWRAWWQKHGGGLDFQRLGSDWQLLGSAKYLEGHEDAIRSVDFSPDGRRIASASSDRTIRIWHTATGRELLRLNGHTAPVRSIAFSPDGELLVSGGEDQTIRIWDTGSGKEIRKLPLQPGPVNCVRFSPDGSRLASGSSTDRFARVWDAASGVELLALEADYHHVNAVAFSPDGLSLASGGYSNDLRVWNLTTLTEDLKKPKPRQHDQPDRIFAGRQNPRPFRVGIGESSRLAGVGSSHRQRASTLRLPAGTGNFRVGAGRLA